MSGNGHLSMPLPAPAILVAVVGAITMVPAQAGQLLTVTTAVRAVRTTALAFVSHFIKVALSTDRDKLKHKDC